MNEKSTLEKGDIELREVLAVCVKITAKLHRLRESARTMESMRTMKDDGDMPIPLPVGSTQ